MARRVRLTRNPGAGGLPYGEWIPAHAVKFHEDGTTSLMTESSGQRNRRRRNVAGYKDAYGFHPIRWDPDYDPEELSRAEGGSATDWSAPRGFFVGSGGKKRKAKAKAKSRKKAPKKTATKKRRR